MEMYQCNKIFKNLRGSEILYFIYSMTSRRVFDISALLNDKILIDITKILQK